MGKIYNINGKYPDVDGKFTITGSDIGFHSTVHEHPTQADIDAGIANGKLPEEVTFNLTNLSGKLISKADSNHIHPDSEYVKSLITDNTTTGDITITGDIGISRTNNDITLTYNAVDTGIYTGFRNVNVQNQPSKAIRLEFDSSALPTDGSHVLEFDYVPNN